MKKNAESFMRSLNNNGRWGKHDELGTLNFITPRKTRSAVKLVKYGVAVSCAHEIQTSPRPDMNLQVMRYTVAKDEVRSMEFIGMVFHGKSITHIDSPAHFFWKGKIYNSHPAEGAEFCDAAVLKTGIATRGVLLDVRGRTAGKAELKTAEKRSGVRVGEGDVLLVRTDKEINVSAAPWLYERKVAVIGSDTPNIAPMFHSVCLTAMGLWILDNCALEELYKECKKRKRWEFFISIDPLRLKNVTGSPVNPVAIF